MINRRTLQIKIRALISNLMRSQLTLVPANVYIMVLLSLYKIVISSEYINHFMKLPDSPIL